MNDFLKLLGVENNCSKLKKLILCRRSAKLGKIWTDFGRRAAELGRNARVCRPPAAKKPAPKHPIFTPTAPNPGRSLFTALFGPEIALYGTDMDDPAALIRPCSTHGVVFPGVHP